MGFLVFVFLYGTLALMITEVFVSVRLSLSYFPFDIMRSAGYRLSFLLWPFYMTTILLNPEQFREGFHCMIIWFIFGSSLVRTVLPPMSSLYEISVYFIFGNIAVWGISYVSCVILDMFVYHSRHLP